MTGTTAGPGQPAAPDLAASGTSLDAGLWRDGGDSPVAHGSEAPAGHTPALPPGRILRPADYLGHRPEPPQLGWQRLAWSAGARWVGPGTRETRHRLWRTRIRRRMGCSQVIAVVSPKGGVGKSTTAAQLGHVLAAVRGDPVVALDANPDFGNLVKRLPEPYSAHSADELHRDADQLRCYNDLAPYLTTADSGLCVIRSSATSATRLGPDEYHHLLAALSRFFSLIIVDLGTGMREPTSRAIMAGADAVVAVTDTTLDGAEVVIEGAGVLRRHLAGGTVSVTVVINGVRRGSGSVPASRLCTVFEPYTPHPVLRVPHDKHLAMGGIPRWSLLAARTQDAYLALAATVVDALPARPGKLEGSQAR